MPCPPPIPSSPRPASRSKLITMVSSIGETSIAVSRHDVEIIFDVLADLEHRIAFEQRPQPGERGVAVDLLRLFGEHVGAAVAERNVAGLVRPHRQADPDEIGLHRIERAGFGVEGDEPRRKAPLDPAIQRLQRLHAFIGGVVDRRHVRQRLARRAFGRVPPRR